MVVVSFTLAQVSDTFAPGMQVGAWLDPMRDLRGGAPAGAAVSTGTVAADGSLTFAAVEAGVRHVAYAAGRTIRFVAPRLELGVLAVVEKVWAVPALASGATVGTTVDVPGAELTDLAFVTLGSVDPIVAGRMRLSAQLLQAGKVTVLLTNHDGVPQDLPTGTLRVTVLRV